MFLPFYLKKSFREALVHAYPKEGSLRTMLTEQCNKSLDEITTANGLSAKVSDVLEDAQAKGWSPELVSGAIAGNPGNPQLRSFLAEVLEYLPVAPIRTNARATSLRLYVWPAVAASALCLFFVAGAVLVYLSGVSGQGPPVAKLEWQYAGKFTPEEAQQTFESTVPGPLTEWVSNIELNASCKGPYLIKTKIPGAMRVQSIAYSYRGREANARLVRRTPGGFKVMQPTGVTFDFHDEPAPFESDDELFLVVGLCSDAVSTEPSVNDQNAHDKIRVITARKTASGE